MEIVQRGFTALLVSSMAEDTCGAFFRAPPNQTPPPTNSPPSRADQSAPSEGGGGEEAGGVLIQPGVRVCSVPGFGLDQWLTNDVYAVVLVDICWQNRSPVRHLEWN